MTHYLVTGGAGFIGSHIVEDLVKRGDQVSVLDNFETGKKTNLSSVINRIRLIKGDIRDLKTCHEACRGVDYVLHEAALGSVPRSIEDPLTTHEVNVSGSLNMLLASRENKVRRFIYASSSSIYGDSEILPKVETMEPRPLSPYALSKCAGETYCRLFFQLFGLETIALRYFNVYGPRQDPHSQYAAVIPLFISSIIEGRSPVIFGDGEQSRDFSYVRDVVQANLKACAASSDICGGIYNIACNKKTTVNKVYNLIKEKLVKTNPSLGRVKPIYRPPRPGDIRDSLADYSLARTRLGFSPEYDIQDGLNLTIRFHLVPSSVESLS